MLSPEVNKLAERLTEQEVYNLIIGGGLRGSVGKIEGTRFYWNDNYGQYDLQDLPSPMFSVSTSDFISTGTNRRYVLGTPQNPYYVAPSGVELPIVNNKEVSGLCYSIRCRQAPAGSPDLYDAYFIECLYIGTDGEIVGENNVECKSLFENSHADIVNACYGALLRDGDYSCGLVGVCTGGEGSTREYYTVNESIGSGANAEYYNSFWGAGQKPIEDDGVFPTGGSGGGGGSYSRVDESIPVPSVPSYSVCDIGTTALYEMAPIGLHDFSNYLWSENFFTAIIKNRQSPMENIIQLSMVPRLQFAGTVGNVVIGNVSTPASGLKLSTSYYQINCGTINVNEYYNSFADYQTEIYIYLPFCGIFPVDCNDCMDGTIQVMYNVDVFSGECVAFVSCNTNGVWHVLATYNGNIAVQFPLADRNMMSYYAGLIGGVASGVGSAMNGNVGGFTSGMMQVLTAKAGYSRAGSIGGASGMMNIKYPFLIFSTPQYFTPKTFYDDCGYISNISGKVSTFSGYLQVDTSKLDLNGLSITEEERTLLYDMLDNGIYI